MTRFPKRFSPPHATTTPCIVMTAAARAPRRVECVCVISSLRDVQSSGWIFIWSLLVVVSRRLARIHPIINRAPGTMTTAPRRRLASLLLLLFLSSSSLAAADDDDERGEPFNGAVHGDDGADDLDEGRFEPAHGSPTDWRDLELAPKFTSVASWQRPQFRVDEGGDYVRMRGWIASTSRAGAGEPVFALPEDAAPGRTERWRVTMKGADRALSVGEDGVAVLDEEMRRENWITLAGFAFNARSAAGYGGGDGGGGGGGGGGVGGGVDGEAAAGARDEL